MNITAVDCVFSSYRLRAVLIDRRDLHQLCEKLFSLTSHEGFELS